MGSFTPLRVCVIVRIIRFVCDKSPVLYFFRLLVAIFFIYLFFFAIIRNFRKNVKRPLSKYKNVKAMTMTETRIQCREHPYLCPLRSRNER